MAQAEIQETLAVDFSKLFGVITKYEDYPSFVEGCSSVEIEHRESGKARVTYRVNMIKEISYTLEHSEDAEKGIIAWTLSSSDFMKKNSGRWELKALGPGRTQAKYAVELEFKISVPSLILNRLIK